MPPGRTNAGGAGRRAGGRVSDNYGGRLSSGDSVASLLASTVTINLAVSGPVTPPAATARRVHDFDYASPESCVTAETVRRSRVAKFSVPSVSVQPLRR
ncbi:unnamed protein product, partial [Iphiclides podalirius]